MTIDLIADDIGLGDERRIFGFESDFANDLRCIPMVVRFKLDRVGVKVSLKQWTRIGAANRARLLAMRCDAEHEVAAYRQALLDLIASHGQEPVVWLAPDPEPAWRVTTRVPAQVCMEAEKNGLPPPAGYSWARLSTLERFALLKLARSNHDNDNFAPAMREFGLCR